MHHSNWILRSIIREDGYAFAGWKRRGEKVTPDFRNPISFKKRHACKLNQPKWNLVYVNNNNDERSN